MQAITRISTDLDSLAHQGRQALSFADPEVAIRRPLADLVEATLNAACKSANTRRSYTVSIALFVAHLETERGEFIPGLLPLVVKWIDGVGLPVTENTGRRRAEYDFGDTPAGVLRLVDQALIDSFFTARREAGDAINTATVRLYAVKTFLSVALRENVLTGEQAKNMVLEPYRTKQRRNEKPVGRRLSKAEARALRAAADVTTPKGARDLAILDLGLFLGLRESEIAGLRMLNFEKDRGRWWLSVTGKNEKTRRLKLHPNVEENLLSWFDLAGLTWHDDRPVFYSVDRWGNISRKQITPTDVSRVVAALGAAAGISEPKGPGRLGAHDLRRTAARTAYDNGAGLLLVQKMLGHARPETTAHYIGLEDTGDSAVDFVRYDD